MPETKSHKRAKKKAAGKKGMTEKPLKGGGRLDASSYPRYHQLPISKTSTLVLKLPVTITPFFIPLILSDRI